MDQKGERTGSTMLGMGWTMGKSDRACRFILKGRRVNQPFPLREMKKHLGAAGAEPGFAG
jgi:hypothetical protein